MASKNHICFNIYSIATSYLKLLDDITMVFNNTHIL